MGYIFEGNGGSMTLLLIPFIYTCRKLSGSSFPRGAFPEHRLNCTQLSNGTWHCSPVEQQCDSFVELGVVCISYEDITNMQVTTQLPTTSCIPQIKAKDTLAVHVLIISPPLLLVVVYWQLSY